MRLDFTIYFVNITATQVNKKRVVPYDLDASYLWHKIKGTQFDAGGSGSTMPIGGTLTSDEIETIEGWILNGAE